jgi:hypothetical protein
MVRELDADILADLRTLLTTAGAKDPGLIAPRGRTRGLLTTAAAVVPIPTGAKAALVYCSTLTKAGVGSAAAAAASVTQQQTITKGDATSGNFKITFQGQQTANIAWNASAATIVSALVALSSIGTAGVTGSGGTLDSAPVVITFAAGVLSGKQPLMTIDTVDLAGGVSAGSRLPTVAETRSASTDAYLYLDADVATGLYRVTWFS